MLKIYVNDFHIFSNYDFIGDVLLNKHYRNRAKTVLVLKKTVKKIADF